jgi:hypothetical protein
MKEFKLRFLKNIRKMTDSDNFLSIKELTIGVICFLLLLILSAATVVSIILD